MRDDPDKQFVKYILSGICRGVHIGVVRPHTIHSARDSNLPLVQSLPSLVTQHIQDERLAGRLLGPLPQPLVKYCQISQIGLIPKLHQPGRWHLIVDLSSPHGQSVNNAISPDISHMHYTSVWEASAVVRQLGRGTKLAKIDLHQAYRMVPVHAMYRMVPVHADDHHLLDIRWLNRVFVDPALPFGLRSAPKIFSAFADALAWDPYKNGVVWQLHSLNDFLFMGPPSSNACDKALETALQTC